MPVYGRLEASHGILQIKGYRPRNYRVGSNQITLYPFQTWELLHHDNIICLLREPKGRLRQPPDERKGAGAMVTYSDLFTFVIMLCAVITLVINIKRKKQRPRPGKIRRYFM